VRYNLLKLRAIASDPHQRTEFFMIQQSTSGRVPFANVHYLGTVIGIGVVTCLAPAISPLIVAALVKHAHLTLAEAGSCASIETAGMCIGTTLALLLATRRSPRVLLGVGLAIMLISNLLSMKIIGFAEFAVARFAAGTGCGLLMLFQRLLVRTTRPQRNFAIFTAFNVIFSAALSVAIPSLLSMGGIGAAYCVVAFLCAACLLNIATISPVVDDPAPAVTARHGVPRTSLLSRVLPVVHTNPQVALVCGMVATYTVALAALWTYMSAYGTSHSLPDSEIAKAISVAWLVGGSLGAAACAWIEGRGNLRRHIIGQLVAFAATTLFLGFTRGPVAFWLGVGVFVFLWMLSFASFMSLLAHLDSSGQLATAGSLIQLVAFVAGPAVGVVLLRNGSLTPLIAFATIGFLFGASCLVGAGRHRHTTPLEVGPDPA
jgi:predicted MFS family arabinose efflux permease